jgi:uncharacterized membrane protein
MNERTATTTHGDAPLTSAYNPDARASGLVSAREDDELTGRTVTINRPLEALFEFWRSPANLVRILDKDVSPPDGLTLEETNGHTISWRADTDQDGALATGRVEFRPAPAGRGTEVTVILATEARGFITRTVDKLTQKDVTLQTRRALRRFKQLMETGEISTSEPGPAAPRAN